MAEIVQTIKEGDLGPSLTTTLTIGGQVPANPASGDNDPASSPNGSHPVGMFIRKDGESCFSAGAGAIVVVDAATWQLRYDYGAGDTDTPGIMAMEWRFTQSANPNQVPHTGPSGGYDLVEVKGREDC